MLRLTRSHITGALLSLLLGVTAASAQHSTEPSLGEAARAERQRRAAQPRTAPARVLTNEDLRRERILPAAEPASVAAAPAGDARPAAAAEVVAEIVAVPAGPEVSLGEYARQLRAQRQARRLRRERAARRAAAPGLRPAAAAPRTQSARRRAAHPPHVSPAAPGTRTEEKNADVIRVRRGDSLWKLARLHLGDGAQWQRLWQANPELADPRLIHPGQHMRLPTAKVPDAPAGLSAAASVGALQLEMELDLELEQARARLAQLSPWAPLWLAPVRTPAPPAAGLAPPPSAARDRS